MNALAQSLCDAMTALNPDGCDSREAERLAGILGSREEIAAYLLLRHETLARQPVVVRALSKLATLGLEVRPPQTRASAFTASHVATEEAHEKLRSAMTDLIQQDLRSQDVMNRVAGRRRDVIHLSPSPTLRGFLDRIRQ